MLKASPDVSQSDEQGAGATTLQALFDAEENALLRYAFSLTGRRAVAEEIVQDVFLKLHQKWNEVETPRAWLYRSVRNRACNHLRDNRREVLQGEDDELLASETDEETAEDLLLRLEATGLLRQILADLDPTDQILLQLKYFENKKYREISEKTGLSIGNVGYRLHHLLKELAEKLRPLGIEK